MTDIRAPRTIFAVFVLLAAIYFFSVYPQMPGRVASHFNAQGAPNGWQSKPVFYGFFIGSVLLVTLAGFGIPWLVNILPMQMINLPNKKYWLAPERRQESLSYLAAHSAWFSCAILLVVIFAFNYAVAYNLHPGNPPDSSAISFPLIAFAVFTVIWMLRLFTRFGHIPDDSPPEK